MAVSMPPASLAAVKGLFAHAQVPFDPKASGVKLSSAEADSLQQAFDKIPANDTATKAAVRAALLQLMQSDAFVPDAKAQDVIAKVIGKPSAQVFSARETADLVGGSSIKNVAAMALQLLAKAPSLDQKQVEKLAKYLGTLPAAAKNLVYATLNNEAKEGNLKFGDGARAPFTKAFAAAEAESGGAVSKMAENFKQEASGSMEYFASAMAKSPYFEDRLAALMFMVCVKGMKESDDALRDLDKPGGPNDDHKKAKPSAAKKPSVTPQSTATGETGQINKGEKAATTPTGQLRSSYESVVQSAAAARADGVITTPEAERLVKKLDTISPPEAKLLQANAMGRALLAMGGGDLLPEMEPLAKWVESTTGKPLADCGDAQALHDAKTPLADTIGGSDRLENKVAAFILDGVFGEGKGEKTKAVMNEMKPLLQAMQQEVTGTTSAEVAAERPKTSQHSQNLEDRFTRIATAAKEGKLKPEDFPKAAASMIERLPLPPADKQAIHAGVTSALHALAANPNHDVKEVFSKAVAPLVAATNTPEVDAIIGGAVTQLKDDLAAHIFDNNDFGKGKDPAAVQAFLDANQPKARQKLLDEAKGQGFTPAQLDALGVSFDQNAKTMQAEVHQEFAATGKVVPSSGQGSDAVDATATDQSRSRQVMFEKVKLQMSRLSEMMQAMSNILNTLHQTAENAIRAIR